MVSNQKEVKDVKQTASYTQYLKLGWFTDYFLFDVCMVLVLKYNKMPRLNGIIYQHYPLPEPEKHSG